MIHTAACQWLPNSEFIAVFDVPIERAGQFTKGFGVNVHADARSMLEKERIEAVSIATPHPLHAAAIQPAAAGATFM